MGAFTSGIIERNSGKHMPTGGFGMNAIGPSPWRTTAEALLGRRDVTRSQLAIPAHILLSHTSEASWESHIQMETERVNAA